MAEKGHQRFNLETPTLKLSLVAVDPFAKSLTSCPIRKFNLCQPEKLKSKDPLKEAIETKGYPLSQVAIAPDWDPVPPRGTSKTGKTEVLAGESLFR